MLLTVAEPNDSFAQAYTSTNDVYLETQYTDSGSVSSAGDTDDYLKFYTNHGASSLYAVLNGLSSDADLYIYNDTGGLLASSRNGGNNSETITVNLPANKYFYVRVAKYGAGTTNYNVLLYNDYAGSTLATAKDIGTSWGQATDKGGAQKAFFADYMDYRDNVDIVKFRTEAPGTISLRRLNSQPLVTNMQLLDASGSVLANAYSDGTGLSVNSYNAPAGTYYVRMQQSAGSGNYSLRVVTDYAGPITATARNWGDVTNTSRRATEMVSGFGGVSYDDALDLYKFSVSQTANVALALAFDQTAFPHPTFGANLYLARDANNNGFIEGSEILQQSNNAGNDSIFRSITAGTYYVGVTQNGAYTTYDLDLDVDLDNPGNVPNPYSDMRKAISLGSLVGEKAFKGGLGVYPGPAYDGVDYFKFTMASAGRLKANVFANPFFSRNRDVYLGIIRDANNNGLADTGEYLHTSSAAHDVSLPAGNYFLSVIGGGQVDYYGRLVADYAGNTTAAARNLGTDPTNGTYRDYIEQDFGAGSDVDDVYKFVLTGTRNVTFKTTGVAGEDLSLALLRSDGSQIVAANVSNSPNETLTRTLTGGTYFIRVRGLNGSTNYTLTTDFGMGTSDPDNTISEANANPFNQKSVGQFFDATMNPLNDVDVVRFTASAGQRVGFDIDGRNGSSLDTYLRIFNSAGTELAANDNGIAPGEQMAKNAYLEYTFPTAGRYYVGVSLNPNKSYSINSGSGSINGNGPTGDYRLTLTNVGAALPTAFYMNAAGNAFTTGDGKVFTAPSGFTGGTESTGAFAVDGTTNDYLYYTRRYGNFSFSKAVANGNYKLQLYFAEPVHTAAGQRKFDVFAEGAQILNDFDIYAAAGATRKSANRFFNVTINDGKLDLSFASVVDNAMLSAIELVKV